MKLYPSPFYGDYLKNMPGCTAVLPNGQRCGKTDAAYTSGSFDSSYQRCSYHLDLDLNP